MLIAVGRNVMIVCATLAVVGISMALWPVADIPPERQLENAGAKLACAFDGTVTIGAILEGPEFGDGHVEIAARIPTLQRLSLAGSNVTNRGIAALHSVSSLKYLNLSRTRWTRESINEISQLSKLKDLSLEGCDWLRDEHIEPLSGLPILEMLNLSATAITPFAFETLARFPKLKLLNLNRCPQIDDSLIDSLIELCRKHPMTLGLAWTEITEDGVARLRDSLPGIRIEMRPETMVGLRDVAQRGQFLTNSKEEIVGFRRRRDIDGFTPALMSGDLTVVSSLPGIRLLSLDQSGVTDDLLLELKFMPRLEHLRLSTTQVTDQGLQVLERLPNLQSLIINDADLTGYGLEHLRHVPQLQNLQFQTIQGNEVLPFVTQLTELQILTIRAPVTNEGIEQLTKLRKLKSLELANTQVRGPGIKTISAIPGLTELVIESDLLDDSDVEYFGSLQNIRRLVFLRTNMTRLGRKRIEAMDLGTAVTWADPEQNPASAIR